MPPTNKTPKQASRNVNVPPLRMPAHSTSSPQSSSPVTGGQNYKDSKPTSPRQQSKVIRLMSSKESREASITKDRKRTPAASTSAREAEIAKLAEGLRAAEAAKKEREAERYRSQGGRNSVTSEKNKSSNLDTSFTESQSPVSRNRASAEPQSFSVRSNSKGKLRDTEISSASEWRDTERSDPGPLALVMKNLERSLEHGKSLYGSGNKAHGKAEYKVNGNEEVTLCDFEDCPGEASLATMLEKLEKNFQTQKAMYKESMALLEEQHSAPPPVRKRPADELLDVVEDLMNFAAPVDLNMPPLSDRPMREPESNTPAGRAKEHMKSFWKVLKDSVETSALCVLQNLYANWQASFLEAVQETVSKTRLAKNASQGSVTEKSGTRNSPRSTVPCSPGAADRLIDMINSHTQGVDRAIEGLLVRSGMGTETSQYGHEAWHDAPPQAQMIHQYSQSSIFAEQRGRSLVTTVQNYDRSSSLDQQAGLRGGQQQNVLPYTIAHGQPIRSRSSAPSFFFEQTTISGQPRSHVYPPARGWSQGFPQSPSPGIPRSPLLSGANCRSVTPSQPVLVPGSTCNWLGSPPTNRSPGI